MSQVLLLVVAFVVVTAAAAQRLVARRFSARIEGLRLDLLVARGPAREDPSALPPLVRAFAERNGGRRDGPLVVRMKQKAEMRLKPGARFFALTATQDSGTRVPGFVWDARGRMAWVAPLRVLDAYAAGAGQLEVRIAGAILVARALGPEVDKGEAIRFLAELPWNPDAILSASGLAWRQVDALTVEVSMATGGGPARVCLQVDEAGDIVGVTAEDRPRGVGRDSQPTAWTGRFWDYTSAGGYRWPRHGEVAWVLPEGAFVYWRGEIVSLAAVPG
jgi:hypothetical protein